MEIALNKLKIVYLIVLSWFCISAPIVSAQDIDEKKLDAIKSLMSVTGATSNSDQFAKAFSQQLVSVLRLSNPEISTNTINIVNEEVDRIVNEEFAAESLQRQIYPIYAEYFTLGEIQALIDFNKSQIGIKANQVMPRLIQDSINAAQNWSQEVGPKISTSVVERLKKEGISIRRVEAAP